MLSLDEAYGPIKGLTLYRDSHDRDLFHYVSLRPQLAEIDGVPEFSFLKYQRDITDNPDFDPETKESIGGGFAALTFHLGAKEEVLREVERELARYTDGTPRLAPIQFRKGSVRLSLSKDAADVKGADPAAPKGFGFVEEVYGTTKPDLGGSLRASFGLVLDREQASIFEAGLQSGTIPICVLYDLEALGLRPAFDVKITADYQRIYSHLEIEFGVKAQIQMVTAAADIGLAFQHLRDSGAIKVEVLHFTDDESLRKQADNAFDWFKNELLKDFFKPALTPPEFMKQAGGGAGGLLSQLQGLLEPSKPQEGPSQPARGEPTTAAPTAAPPATNQASGVADLPASGTAGAAAGGGGASGGGGFGPIQLAFSLKYYRQEELKTREFEYSMRAAVARDFAPQGLVSTMVAGLDLDRLTTTVSADDDFFKRLVATVSVGGDLAASGVATAAVNLEYPGERAPGEPPRHVDGAVFRPDQLTPYVFTSWLDDKKDLSYRYRMDVHFKPDSPFVGAEPHVRSDWRVTRDRQLTIDPLDAADLLDVEVTLGKIDAGEIGEVQVELVHHDPASGLEPRRTIRLRPGDPAGRWRVRLADGAPAAYQHRTTYFLAGGLRWRTGWTPSTEPTLVVNDPFQNELKLRLFPLLDPAALLEASIDVSYEEPATGYERRARTTFAGPVLAAQDLSIPTLAEDPESFTYQVVVIRNDGSVFQSGTREASADTTALVISDGAGSTHRIRARLLGTDLASAGLLAVKLQLRGPGADPDTTEALFTPSQVADQTLTLVQPDGGGPFRYTYAVTGYTTAGLPVPGASGETGDVNLLIPLPSN
jgi:hypothetical protein